MSIFPVRALWKGLRGRSLTFSIVFAMAIMGSSFAGLLRMPLRTIGIWAPLVLILPIVATGLMAKYENRLPIRESFKRSCSVALIFGSVLVVACLARYESWLESRYADSVQFGERFRQTDTNPLHKRGPRSRP